MCLETVDNLPAGQPWKAQVQHNAVKLLVQHESEGLLASRDRHDLRFDRFHQTDDVLSLNRIVLDDEDGFLGCANLGGAGRTART